VTDHAVLIPTSEGPVGGIVSQPDGTDRAGMILLSGYGRPARSGINSLWARLARRLAAMGVVVLRVDYSREGETLPIGEGVSGQAATTDLDLLLLDQALRWFHGRLNGLDVFFAGACAGGRIAIELAGANPGVAAGTFAIVPSLRPPVGSGHARGDSKASAPDDPDAIDPQAIERLRAVEDRGPTWILTGELDDFVTDLLPPLLATEVDLEVESVPGLAIHFLDQPVLQEQVERRVTNRVARVLMEREPLG